MEKNVERYLEEKAENIGNQWESGISYVIESFCKSPIEKLFYIELAHQITWDFQQPKDCPKYRVMLQRKITIKDKQYIVDFLIYYTIDDRWQSKKKSQPELHKDQALIIELDSYLWHGSDPEQFTKEKEREREIQKEGWNIMRFSGREVVRNTEKCVDQVMSYFINIKNRICEHGI